MHINVIYIYIYICAWWLLSTLLVLTLTMHELQLWASIASMLPYLYICIYVYIYGCIYIYIIYNIYSLESENEILEF